MSKIILVSATPLEHGGLKEINGLPIFQVGIGKTNAASNLTEILWNEEPDTVINFGSCGNLKDFKVGEIIEVGTTYNNIDVRPFAPYANKYLEMINSCDIVDMECYSLAYVCIQRNINFKSFKWISDDGDIENWERNAAIGFDNFKEVLIDNLTM